jgi:hypothetical protein
MGPIPKISNCANANTSNLKKKTKNKKEALPSILDKECSTHSWLFSSYCFIH